MRLPYLITPLEWLFWPLLGALIGVGAAVHRGFSQVAGFIGGLLLGPLAILMFLVSGVASADERRVPCPHCAEGILTQAKVCRYCGRDV